jgi:aryl-alcohol dehydrogenase-like predicted oxidoreductase
LINQSQSRIALGTAQLGMDYGVANQTGRPSTKAALAILERAIQGGVRWFDTAQSYGPAEQILGEFVQASAEYDVAVVTKLSAAVDPADENAICRAVYASCATIGRPLAGVLVHDPSRLALWTMGLGRALASCRDAGLTSRIGASVYGPAQFATALELPGLTMIQAPYNVLDQRVEREGLLDRARKGGIKVMLRSPFLQGALLMARECRPEWLRFAAQRLDAWLDLCERHRADPTSVALRFVLDRNPDTVVVGCETIQQLDGILAAASKAALASDLLEEVDHLATDDPCVVDPSRWPTS